MYKIAYVLIAAFLALGYSLNASASSCHIDGSAISGEAAKSQSPINDICPVMGGEVNKAAPDIVEYKGKTIGLCCPGCAELFMADPGKYGGKDG